MLWARCGAEIPPEVLIVITILMKTQYGNTFIYLIHYSNENFLKYSIWLQMQVIIST